MGVGVLKWAVAALFCCLILAHVASSVPAPSDYDTVNDMYDWLSAHEVERRGPPSMRLRFGKRANNIRSWQQVSQRSEPSLRLRYGKRAYADEAEPLLDHELERRDRTPALRLRFGKRTSEFGQEDTLGDSDFLREDRAPKLRLRFGKRGLGFGQENTLGDSDFIRQDRAPALRLRFGKRDLGFGQEEDASATSQEEPQPQ